MARDSTEYVTGSTRGKHATEQNDNLELYLGQIRKIFDTSRIIEAPRDKQQVVNYFLLNKLSYRLGFNWDGFIHCGISYDGKSKREDFRQQARMIERYIIDNDARNVLELAYGLGPNSAFLARSNPDVTFEALDIANKPLARYTKIPNLHFCYSDYHDLSRFEDNSLDIIFVIEALCYSTNKLHVLREVKRKLKEGGVFIVFDAYTRNRASQLSPSEKLMWQLIFRGCALETFERLDKVEAEMRKEFSIVMAQDLTTYVLPSLEVQESKARHYFDHPAVARAINKVLAFDVVKHLPMVLLMPTSVRRQIGCYYLHALKNDQ
ncbi:MAG: class I SAM-dependent methyltransferase [Halobacteriota archaeon]|jgi:ubiquinone/menaquinone biosynthesis C-methylase UbiE